MSGSAKPPRRDSERKSKSSKRKAKSNKKAAAKSTNAKKTKAPPPKNHLLSVAGRLLLVILAVAINQSDPEWGLVALAAASMLLVHGVHLWVVDRCQPTAKQLKLLLLGGGIVTIVGLGIVGTRPSDWGGGVVLSGWFLLMYGIHCFGRLGTVRTSDTVATESVRNA